MGQQEVLPGLKQHLKALAVNTFKPSSGQQLCGLLFHWGLVSGWASWLAEVAQQTMLRDAPWTNSLLNPIMADRQRIVVTSLRNLPLAVQHTMHCQLTYRHNWR